MSPLLSKETFARRGEEIYEQQLHRLVGHEGKFIAIDIESAEFVVDERDLDAMDRLTEKKPEAQIWLRRIGNLPSYRIGAHRSNELESI